MGAESSYENTSSLQHLKSLVVSPKGGDVSFWFTLFKRAPTPLSSEDLVDLRFLCDVGSRFPSNLENLACFSLMCAAEAAECSEPFDSTMINSLSLAVKVLTAVVLATVRRRCLSKVLHHLDAKFFVEAAENDPQMQCLVNESDLFFPRLPARLQPDATVIVSMEGDKESLEKVSVVIREFDNDGMPTKKELIRYYKAVRKLRGNVFTRFFDILMSLMFKPGLTISVRKNNNLNAAWKHTGNHADFIREEILRALLILLNLDNFKVLDPQMSADSRFTSVLNAEIAIDRKFSFRLLSSICAVLNNCSKKLAQMMLCLAVVLFRSTEFNYELASFDSNKLISLFFVNTKFSLNENDSLSLEKLSLFFMCLATNNAFAEIFINNSDSIIDVLTYLLNIANLKYNESGSNYIHSIIVTSILLIFQAVNKKIDDDKENKTEEGNPKLSNNKYCIKVYRDKEFIDYLFDTFFDICKSNTFIPSFICLLHLISPKIKNYSLQTVNKFFLIFEKANLEQKRLIADVIASLVQIPGRHSSVKAMVLIKHNVLFDFDPTNNTCERQAILIKFASKFKRVIAKKLREGKIESASLTNIAVANVAKAMKVKNTFPEYKSFLKHPEITPNDILNTWKQWSTILAQSAVHSEIACLKNLPRV